MRVADYKEVRAYALAFESALEIFGMRQKWPSDERYSLADQIRRSSRSTGANIAAAWRKRRYEAAFVSRLSDSDEEAAETEVHLEFALRCGYLLPREHARLRDHHDHICRQLTKMMDDAASWCDTGCELREVEPQHVVPASERESVHAPRSDAPSAPRS